MMDQQSNSLHAGNYKKANNISAPNKRADKIKGKASACLVPDVGSSNLDLTCMISELNSKSLLQGIILSEILGSPKALKRRKHNLWSSRF